MTDETRIAAEAARDAENLHEKRRRGWGCFAYAAIAVLAPALALTLGWMILAVADGQLAAAAEQRARDTGDPLTAAEMRALYGSTPESEEATAKWIAALRATERIGTANVRNVPILGSNIVPATLDERGLYDAATLARAEPFLAAQGAEALNRAHAARDRALDVRYPIAFEQGYDAPIENIQELRTLANLLALETEVRAAKGDLTGATDSLLTLIAASETLAEAPDVIAYLLRVAILGVASEHAMNLIERTEFPPKDLQRLQEAFARQSFQRQLLRSRQADQYQALQSFRSDTPIGPVTVDRLRWLPFRGGDQALTLDLHREFLEEAAEGFPEADRAAQNADAKLDGLAASGIVDQFRFAHTLQTRVAFGAYVNASLRGEAEARIAATCCACERFRRERGEWPPTLAAVVPDYFPEIPLDPVDDRPLRYEVNSGRMTIHSLGHFRAENSPNTHTFDDGFVSEVLDKKSQAQTMGPAPPEEPNSDGR